MKKGLLTQLWEKSHAFFSVYYPVDAPRVLHVDMMRYITWRLKQDLEDEAMACLKNYFAERVADTGVDPENLHELISKQLAAYTLIDSEFSQKVAKADPTAWLPQPKSE